MSVLAIAGLWVVALSPVVSLITLAVVLYLGWVLVSDSWIPDTQTSTGIVGNA